MNRLSNRLENLEATLPDSRAIEEQSEQGQADAERERALWEAVFSTMSAEHVEHVVTDLTAGLEGDESDLSALTRQVIAMVHQHFHQAAYFPQPPLEMPAAIAEVYLQHTDAVPLHDCEQCGARIPILTGQSQPARTARRFFDRCPICSGRAGYEAYLNTMRGAIRRCSRCAELQPANAVQVRHLQRHGKPRCTCGAAITEAVESPENRATRHT
jgi:hypothetical protein